MSIFVLVPLLYLAAVSVPLAVTDARSHRLPNALVVPGLVLLAWAVAGVGLREPPSVVAPLVAGGAAVVVFGAGWALGGVGMGDVKLGVWLAGLAGMTGVFERPGLSASGLAAAAVLAAASFAGEPHGRIPFGPPLLAAFWCTTLPALLLPAPPLLAHLTLTPAPALLGH